MARYLIGIAVFIVTALAVTTPLSYADAIHNWQQHRDQGLRSPDGWLTLVGLFWLNPGDNTIGSAESNNFVLPKQSAPEHVGTLKLQADKITFHPADGSPTKNLSYNDEKPDTIKAGTVSFFIIKRGNKFAVRARDSASSTLKNFTGMQYFPTNTALHFEARLIPDVKKIPILNILGATELEESPGFVEFSYQGTHYRLRPIYEGKTLFFLFKDLRINSLPIKQAGC